MRNTAITFVLLVCLVTSTYAQDAAQQNKKAVVVPQEIYLPVIIPQPDCPLKIEKAGLLKFLNGQFGRTYELRNIGNKPIRAYTIALWNSDNTGDIINWHINENAGLIMPGLTASNDGESIAIIPLSEELQKKLDLTPPMKKIIFFMILEVEFSNGSKYDAKQILDSLSNHLRNFEMIYEKNKELGIKQKPSR
jgi:hypothetical protein